VAASGTIVTVFVTVRVASNFAISASAIANRAANAGGDLSNPRAMASGKLPTSRFNSALRSTLTLICYASDASASQERETNSGATTAGCRSIDHRSRARHPSKLASCSLAGPIYQTWGHEAATSGRSSRPCARRTLGRPRAHGNLLELALSLMHSTRIATLLRGISGAPDSSIAPTSYPRKRSTSLLCTAVMKMIGVFSTRAGARASVDATSEALGAKQCAP
jgi:hypothetical protein